MVAQRRDLFSELSVVFMDTTTLSFVGAGVALLLLAPPSARPARSSGRSIFYLSTAMAGLRFSPISRSGANRFLSGRITHPRQ